MNLRGTSSLIRQLGIPREIDMLVSHLISHVKRYPAPALNPGIVDIDMAWHPGEGNSLVAPLCLSLQIRYRIPRSEIHSLWKSLDYWRFGEGHPGPIEGTPRVEMLERRGFKC